MSDCANPRAALRNLEVQHEQGDRDRKDAIAESFDAVEVLAAVLYGGIGFLVPVSWILLYTYVPRHRELLIHDIAVSYARLTARQSLISIVLYPIAALVGFWQPVVAVVVFVFIPLIFIATLLLPAPATGPSSDD